MAGVAWNQTLALLLLDNDLAREVIRSRRRLGIDQHDEVWEGVYVVSPLADDSHQDLAGTLTSILRVYADLPTGTKVRPGVNISDRVIDWKFNFRAPDVVVFLPDTKAVCHGAFWHGGPDFAVEIVSRGDRTRKKLPFYGSVGTRELLVVDRRPWRLELYRLDGRAMISTGIATIENAERVRSQTLGLEFSLRRGEERPAIEVRRRDGMTWLA
jgi:Uma2 family endonuclease